MCISGCDICHSFVHLWPSVNICVICVIWGHLDPVELCNVKLWTVKQVMKLFCGVMMYCCPSCGHWPFWLFTVHLPNMALWYYMALGLYILLCHSVPYCTLWLYCTDLLVLLFSISSSFGALLEHCWGGFSFQACADLFTFHLFHVPLYVHFLLCITLYVSFCVLTCTYLCLHVVTYVFIIWHLYVV